MEQLFRMPEILSKAVDALLGDLTGERRRARERYAQSGELGGRYGDILRGWQGQAEVIRARLVKEVLATRLDSSSGQELKDLAKSEYLAALPSEPKKAIGEFTLHRVVINTDPATSGTFDSGVIPSGTKFKRVIGKNLRYPAPDSEFVTALPVTCPDVDSLTTDMGSGNWKHEQVVVLSVEATREGPHANLAHFNGFVVNPLTFSIAPDLFDPLFTVSDAYAAGGTLGVVDEQIRALARALAVGSGGPTNQAVLAGALTNPGIRHVAYVNDYDRAEGRLFLADESWGSSDALGDMVLRSLRDYPWIGWGCRVSVSRVINIGIVVQPTVMLRSPDYVPFAAEITANIVKALQSYFDDRPDWWTWTLNAVGAVVGAADDRILACTDVAVLDQNGDPRPEPPADLASDASYAIHFALIDERARPIYQLPGA